MHEIENFSIQRDRQIHIGKFTVVKVDFSLIFFFIIFTKLFVFYCSPVPTTSETTVEDKLSQLQELVQKGEKRGLFEDSVPSEIQRSVSSIFIDSLQCMFILICYWEDH